MNKLPLITFISRLSKRERVIFAVSVFCASVVLLDRLVLSPIFARMDRLDAEIRLQEELIQKSVLTAAYEERIRNQRDRYAAYLSEPQSEEKEVTEFLKEVENLAKGSSVYLIDIKPTDKIDKDGAKQYFLRMDFEAQMDQVINFLHSIAASQGLLRVERFQIRPKTEGSSIAYCSMSIFKTIIFK